MNTFQEYPATHSMSTAWYFVDEDDNVAIYDIHDNGPKPRGVEEELGIGELCFDLPVKDINGIKTLNLTDEQVVAFFEGHWMKRIHKQQFWWDVIVQIDVNRLNSLVGVGKWYLPSGEATLCSNCSPPTSSK